MPLSFQTYSDNQIDLIASKYLRAGAAGLPYEERSPVTREAASNTGEGERVQYLLVGTTG